MWIYFLNIQCLHVGLQKQVLLKKYSIENFDNLREVENDTLAVWWKGN